MKNKVDAALAMLGLATRAGRTVSGTENCGNAVRYDKAHLVLAATDASPKTVAPLRRLCGHHVVPVIDVADRERLGKFTGKDSRAVVAVTDKGFADRIQELLEAAESESKMD